MFEFFKQKTSNALGFNSFKSKKSLEERRQESNVIKSKFPSKIPVVVERYAKEKQLPALDKTKFLVPEELSVSQLQAIIRSRLQLEPTKSFFLFVDKRTVPTMSQTMMELCAEYLDEDGFLYFTYFSQEVFG